MATSNWWGKSCNMNLHDCDPDMMKDPKAIERYVKEVCKVIDMKRVGPARIKRFGHGTLRGYSLMQFIETSSIVGHFDEKGNRAFIDIFSCKPFSAKKTATFTKKFFKASDCKMCVEEHL